MILCCGEALIDMLPDVNTDGGHVLRPVTGGSVFNTAIALGRLTESTGFLSGISTDGFGQSLIKELEAASVNSSLCIRSDRPTTLAVVDLSEGDATYTFYDEGSAGRLINASDISPVPNEVTTLLFGGISLIAEPCGKTYEDLLIQSSSDHLIYLDPNIRSNFIDDEDKHRDRIRHMIQHSDIIKVSTEDLEWIEPNIDPVSAVQKWLKNKTSLVLLSRGSGGSEAHGKNGIVKVDAAKITVVDTVGAGDTFSAGFLSSLNKQVGLRDLAISKLDDSIVETALRFANKTAAITASRAGANPPRLDEVIA
jgi:fructokinase